MNNRMSGIEVQPTLATTTREAAPNAVKLEVNRVQQMLLTRRQSTSSKLVGSIARKSISSSKMLRASGVAQGHGKILTPEKSRRERERVASIARAPSIVEGEAAPTEGDGPSSSALDRFVGTWKGGAVKGRDDFLKAMELPWLVRKVATMLPNFDMIFFKDEEGVLRSHASTFGKVVEERYLEGGTSTKTFKGITTTVTYHWEGDVLTYTVAKEAAPEEEAKSRRWIELDGKTMKAETHARKNAQRPWAVLHRTWIRVEGS